MSAADWFPVNPGKYLKNTLHLTTRQHGGYWLLILAAFEGCGVLPGTDAGLMAITKLDGRAWKEDGPVLKAFLARRGDEWIHEYVMFEWNEAQARIAAKSEAGKIGAKKRWQGRGRGNGSAIAVASVRQWQNDAHLQLQEHETTTPCVTTTARDRATHTGRVGLVPLDWEPSEADLTALRKGRPDLVGDWYTTRMQDFRDWCASAAVTSHDVAATWRGFMRKSRNAPKGMETDAEVEAAIERSKDFGKPGYKYGG